MALWVAVVVAAWRIGGARGEVLRDLLMHPRGRALTRAECDVLTALPRLLIARIVRRRQPGTTYHSGTFGLALGLAFTPVMVAEAAVLHLLLHGSWIAWVLTALHVYGLIWLWGLVLGPQAFPHRVGTRTAVLRNGAMYRVKAPLTGIVTATARTEKVHEAGAVAQRDGAVLLHRRGRVDVWLEFAEPVHVQRPWGEPLATHRIGIASDEPEALVAHLLAEPVARPAGEAQTHHAGLGLIAALDGAGIVRDAAQPA